MTYRITRKPKPKKGPTIAGKMIDAAIKAGFEGLPEKDEAFEAFVDFIRAAERKRLDDELQKRHPYA